MDNAKLPRVPYGMTVHGKEEIDAVINVLKTSTQMGKHVLEMEQKIACLFDKKFGIMLNSGSSANYLAIEVLGLPENSEVITPILTFSTTVAPLIRNKLIPVFADVSPGTYNIDADQIIAFQNSNDLEPLPSGCNIPPESNPSTVPLPMPHLDTRMLTRVAPPPAINFRKTIG